LINETVYGNDITMTLKLFVELFNPVNVCCKRAIDNTIKKNWRPSKLMKNEVFINLKICSCDRDSDLNISSMSSMGGNERR